MSFERNVYVNGKIKYKYCVNIAKTLKKTVHVRPITIRSAIFLGHIMFM